jgi:hypothetical protein
LRLHLKKSQRATELSASGNPAVIFALWATVCAVKEETLLMIDIFAWIVLLILVASAIAIFFIAGSLPGHIAKSRNHPWAQAVTVAGWVTLICGFVLWPVVLIWAYVDIPAAHK